MIIPAILKVCEMDENKDKWTTISNKTSQLFQVGGIVTQKRLSYFMYIICLGGYFWDGPEPFYEKTMSDKRGSRWGIMISE